jgi:outer membrane protein assembly factor BamB
VTTTHVTWKAPRGAPNKPSILLLDGLIYMVNDGGVLTCLDAKTGEEVWKNRLTDSYSASPIAAGGRIYFFSEDGKATVIEAGREFKKIAENTLSDGFMASPAVDGNALYLRTKTHLYRVEAR